MPRPFSRLSLQWKLPLLVGGLVVAVAAGLLYAAYREIYRSYRGAAEERMVAVATQIVSSLRANAQLSQHDAHLLATRPEVRRFLLAGDAASRAALRDALLERPRLSPELTYEFRDRTGIVLFSDGPHAAAVAGLEFPDPAGLAELPDSARTGLMQAKGDTIFYPVVALVAHEGRTLGYVVGWTRLRPQPRAREQIGALLVATAALYLGSPGGVWTDQVGVVAEPAGAAHPADLTVHRNDEGRRLAISGDDPTSRWRVVIEYPDSAVVAPATRWVTRYAMIVAVIGLVGLGIAWLLSQHVTVPLRRLTAAAGSMATGEHPVRVPSAGEDEVGRLAVAFNRMADQVESEAAARLASETQWRLLFARHPHPMWVFDIETLRFLAVNEAMSQVYGWSREELLAMTIKEIRPPEDIPRMLALVAEPRQLQFAPRLFRHRRRDGTDFEVEVTANDVDFLGRPSRLVLAQDVSSRRALEAQLRQAQKMEAIGRLAGGVAHDFNNLLAVIMTYTEMVRAGLSEEDARHEDLGQVLGAADKAHGLTRQLLAFSRQQVLQPETIDPNASVADVERMLRRVIGEDIAIATRLDPDAGHILVDPGQFEQAVLNLAVNARDAMPQGGHLVIATSVAEIDESSRELHGLAMNGRFTVLSVTDDGAGMSAETRARVFEPFFTTKDVGKGTGLGLATVYAIVTQAGGGITVYSEPGMGSTFRLYFPQVQAGPLPLRREAVEGTPPRGAETILLVEDDAAVRSATFEVLRRLGYNVLPAASAQDAIAAVERYADPIDLVLSDVVMPEMDGPALIARLREDRPTLRALLMSGYTGDMIRSRGIRETGIPFLEKPFTVNGLGRKVREVLEES